MYSPRSEYKQPRFFSALQQTDNLYTAAEWLLLSLGNDIQWLAEDGCTQMFIDLANQIDLVLPFKNQALFLPNLNIVKPNVKLQPDIIKAPSIPQASQERLRDLIPPLPASKIQKSNIISPLLIPAVPLTNTIKTTFQNKPIPEVSILNFFPYNQLKMPVDTKLVFDKLVFLLIDNRKQTLNATITFFEENFFCNTAVNFKGSKDRIVPGTENITVNVVICEFTGSYKLSFSNVLSNQILFKILQANKIHLEKNKDLLLENKTLILPFHLGKITRFNLKITCISPPTAHFYKHQKFIIDEIQEKLEAKKVLPFKPIDVFHFLPEDGETGPNGIPLGITTYLGGRGLSSFLRACTYKSKSYLEIEIKTGSCCILNNYLEQHQFLEFNKFFLLKFLDKIKFLAPN